MGYDPAILGFFADETARLSSLGGDDALLVVALEDRSDAIWASDTLPISDAELDSVIVDVLEPGLREGDFAAAVIATAEQLGQAAASGFIVCWPRSRQHRIHMMERTMRRPDRSSRATLTRAVHSP